MTATRPKLRWRTLAIPNEHGAWAFLLEPALLGLGVAPGAAGLAVVGAGLGALLAQHPLGMALADLRRGKRYPRTLPAALLAGAYAVLAAAMLAIALLGGAPAAALWPLAAALPAALVQLAFDARNRGRDVRAVLAGAVALGALAATVGLVGGASTKLALALWLVAAARTAPSILYVRARLLLQRGAGASRAPSWVAHAVALLAVTAAAWWGVLPRLSILAFGVLFARAAIGLRPGMPALAAKRVGMLELGYGLLTVAAVLAGVWLGW